MRMYFYKQSLFAILLILLCCKDDAGSKPDSTSEEKFVNPVLEHAPDPWVTQKDGWYYFTHTTGNNLRLFRTKKMSDLKNASSKVVWTPPSSGFNSKNIWAPEIHFIEGKWYFYYAADNGTNAEHR